MSGPRIIIAAGIWRRTEVRIDPPRADMPLRTFADHALASAFAHQLAALRGWQVVDHCQPQERGQ